jgi:hypothetical protein
VEKVPKYIKSFTFVKQVEKSYVYRCKCGKERFFTKTKVEKNELKCGCILFKDDILNKDEMYLFKRYINGANSRNLKFNLSQQDFKDLIYQSCEYCNSEPAQKFKSVTYSGIDRIFSNRDYCPDNCRSCCFRCNRAKSNMGFDEFYKWIEKIAKYQNDIFLYEETKFSNIQDKIKGYVIKFEKSCTSYKNRILASHSIINSDNIPSFTTSARNYMKRLKCRNIE